VAGEKEPWFMKKTDCDSCGVLWNESSTVAYQIERCRDCSRNPALQFIKKKHVHDHFEIKDTGIIPCDKCSRPMDFLDREQNKPNCGKCKRNPMNAGKKRFHDWFCPKAGDFGDCGNWAIAFQRKHGGKLYAAWDAGDAGEGGDEVLDPPELGHVVVFTADNIVHDAYGEAPVQEYYENIHARWGYYPEDLVPIDEGEVFKLLPHTNEARINELLEEGKTRA